MKLPKFDGKMYYNYGRYCFYIIFLLGIVTITNNLLTKENFYTGASLISSIVYQGFMLLTGMFFNYLYGIEKTKADFTVEGSTQDILKKMEEFDNVQRKPRKNKSI